MEQINLKGRMVCVVDDHSKRGGDLATRLSRAGIRMLPARNSKELFVAIGEHNPDCILMHFAFASENGLFVQSEVQHRFLDAPPVIMVCERGEENLVLKAFRTGVSDCLTQAELVTDELFHSMKTAIRRHDAAKALRTELEGLRRQSVYDEVHGFYRRENLEELLARSLDISPQMMKSRAILLIRIDPFRSLVEQAGQVAGRKLNRAFALRLRDNLRRTDFCGRYDPATFIYVVDNGTSRAGIEALVGRLQSALRFSLELESMRLNVSAQIATAYFPDDGMDVKSLLLHAERQLSTDSAAQDDRSSPEETDAQKDRWDVVRWGNRRATPRNRVFKRGQIVSRNASTVIDCTIRDQSDGGARLRLDDVYAVPPYFDLVVGTATRRPVRRVWQHSYEIGIAYAGADVASRDPARDVAAVA